jgi:RNA-binding protein
MTGTSSSLRGKQRRHLRGLGVALKPVVFVGKEGLTDSVLEAVEREITDRELIKVRLLNSVVGDRRELSAELARRSGTDLVQVLGRTALLWRRNDEEPRIELPE